MAFNGNKGDEQLTTERKLFTGLCNMKVTSVNPTMAELQEMGINAQQEPEYCSTIDVDGQSYDKVRLDFYLESEDEGKGIKAKIAFWLENRVRLNQDGTKGEYLNDSGNSAWGIGENPPDYDWFDKTGIRRALVGEEMLYRFIKPWLNISTQKKDNGKYPECKLDSIGNLFKGNFSEIKQLVSFSLQNGNSVKVLLGVRINDDGKTYQDVYSKHFERSYVKTMERWNKKLRSEYDEYKNEYQNSLMLQEYLGSAEVLPDGVAASSDTPDDNPF